MWRLSVCLFLCGICLLSAVQPHAGNGFYYTKYSSIFRRNAEEECRVCFAHDCVPLSPAKCEYYMATSELQGVSEEEDRAPNSRLQSKVDALLYDILEIGQDYQEMACIPLISTYTDCSKENLCTGCTTCSCDDGRWVCGVEECRVDKLVGGKQLVVAMTSLKFEGAESGEEKEDQFARNKRAVNVPRTNETEVKITFDELSQWMNETNLHAVDGSKGFVATSTESNHKRRTSTSDPDYLAFDEVLSNIAVDSNKVSRKKPALESVEADYVTFIDIVANNANLSDAHKNNYASGMKYPFDEDSFKVDLLKGQKSRLVEQLGLDNYTGIDKDIGNYFESNYLDDANALTIAKRDVSQMNDSKFEESADNNTETLQDFKNNVLYPLVSIIGEKENELNQLLGIKDSLIELIKGMDSNFTLDQMANSTEQNKTLFSIYKLEILPENHFETRRVKGIHNVLDLYLKKLQRDVTEIVRDLKAIKDSLITKKLPKDLAVLMRALRHYIRNQGRQYLKNYRQYNNLRRSFKGFSDTRIKHIMFEILELCDKELADHESLKELSETTRALLQRVIKQNQIDDFAAFGLRISDPAYNITKDLKGVGARWSRLSEKFFDCPPSDKLYHLKLLHLMLTVDINKMSDTLKLLNFAQNRRTNLDIESSDQEVSRVQNDINDLNDKVQKYFQRRSSKDDIEYQNEIIVEKKIGPAKRRSFLKQIRKMFKNSRKDAQSMLDNRVSKSEIVKKLAKNKLGELAKQKMSQYEDTLKKWQVKLNVRSKRSAHGFRVLKDRMKNILPSYLIGKVDPAINIAKKKHYESRSRIRKEGRNSSSRVNNTRPTKSISKPRKQNKANNVTTRNIETTTTIKP